jgi:muramidase (phage lysozyme)
MSDFKIIGNTDPVVGKEEFYSVNTFLPSILPFQNTASNNSFEQPVKWEIYILENGRWRKTKENDKTGKRISYTFLQKSLERKGIRILARRGEDVARLNVTTHPAEKPKIESIELLDKNGKIPSKALSYGQTLKARVHCLHMEKHKVSVTLWEDDAAGAGHNKENEKNIIQTLSGVVKNGKADVDFLLKPSFAKIANKSKDEGKIHEYYVTTDFNKDKIASNNVDVNDLEVPVAPYKGKTKPQQPANIAPAKPKMPASNTSTTPKGEITNVHITDTAGRAINGIFNEKQIRIYIDSKGLIGKEVHLKLYDHDNGSPNDLLIEEKFTISANIHARTISLDTIPRSLGGNFIEEGAQQELFADVEVIETKKNKESKIVKVDAKVFKQDQNEVVNTVMKIFESSLRDKKNEEGTCECEARVRAFMRMLRVGEGTGEVIKTFDKKKNIVYVNHDFDKGYTTAYNNNKITDLSTHPQVIYDGDSSAAGAYQVMRYVWWELSGFEVVNKKKTGKYDIKNDLLKKYKITDYSKEAQDKICLVIIKKQRPNLINKIIKNDIKGAIQKDGCFIWASLPEDSTHSHYKLNGKLQPATPLDVCIEHYNDFLKEELANKSPLHLKKGFLKDFVPNCCTDSQKKQKEQEKSCTKCNESHFDVAKAENWVHQRPSECWQASIDILANYGLRNNSGYPQNRIIMADQEDKKLIPKSTQKALDYLDSQLKIGNPIVVGVDDNLREATYNSHRATEHFFVIVGKGCENGKIYYRFFDVGSRVVGEGTAEKNKLYLLDNKLLEGKSYGGTHNYTVTEVRRNN